MWITRWTNSIRNHTIKSVRPCPGLLPHHTAQGPPPLLVPFLIFIDETGAFQLVKYPVVIKCFRKAFFPLLGGNVHLIQKYHPLEILKQMEIWLKAVWIWSYNFKLFSTMNTRISKQANTFDRNSFIFFLSGKEETYIITANCGHSNFPLPLQLSLHRGR